MNYPDVLKEHNKKSLWKYEDCFKNENPFFYVKCYTHKLECVLGMHSHSFFEINIIVSGSGRHYIGSKNCAAERGTVFVIPPNIKHGYYFEKELCVYHILLGYGFFERFGNELSALSGYPLLFEIEPSLRGEFEQSLFLRLDDGEMQSIASDLQFLEREDRSNQNNIQISRNATVLKLISYFCTLASENERIKNVHFRKNKDFPIIKSMEFLSEHCEKKQDFQKLARDSNMSYATFLRHFKNICGRSPINYLNGCRVDRAKRILKSTGQSITEIGLECGFYDSSHFIRTFKEFTGISPAKYREQ